MTTSNPLSSADVPWQEWATLPRFGIRYRHLTLAAVGDRSAAEGIPRGASGDRSAAKGIPRSASGARRDAMRDEQYHVGVAIEELPPGMQSAPAHYHFLEEEHVYILDGALTARIGAEQYDMKAGDYVCFPAGQQLGHCLINNSGAVCRYVVLGERNPKEIVVYTDSNKVLVRALGRRAIFDLGARRSYWDGENTGLPDGVLPPVDPSELDIRVSSSAKPRPPISADDVGWDEETTLGNQFGGRSKHLTYAALGVRITT